MLLEHSLVDLNKGLNSVPECIIVQYTLRCVSIVCICVFFQDFCVCLCVHVYTLQSQCTRGALSRVTETDLLVELTTARLSIRESSPALIF